MKDMKYNTALFYTEKRGKVGVREVLFTVS